MISWNEGLEKVSLTKLQMECLKLNLKQAKVNVDMLLEGRVINFNVESIDVANEFVKKATKIGVNCVLEDNNSESK